MGEPVRRTGRSGVGWRIGVAAALALTLGALGAPSAPVGAAGGWSGPTHVQTGFCEDVAAALDRSGGRHVVASCGGHVRYLSSDDGSSSWAATEFAVPSDLEDLQPKIAIDGSTVYVAFTREAFGTCGFSWTGIYYRTRSLSGGRWSAARPIGSFGDHLQALRVVGGVIHLTVDAGPLRRTYYEVLVRGVLTRHLVPGAVSDRSSLRIGSDGRARIAYEGASALRYAVFTSHGFTTLSIPGTTSADRFPLLVLGSGNVAHVIWQRVPEPGCGGEGAITGTYYATNRGGPWTPGSQRRVTSAVGATSLTLDLRTGRVHVLLGGEFGLRSYVKSAGGTSWTRTNLSAQDASSVAIRMDPRDGSVLAVETHAGDEPADSGVFAFTTD